jgi:hypothetical protein
MQFPRDDCNPNKVHLDISPYQRLMCSNRRYNSKRKKEKEKEKKRAGH